jgi:hypothetical protein
MTSCFAAVNVPAAVNVMVCVLPVLKSNFELSDKLKLENVNVLVSAIPEVPSIPPFIVNAPVMVVLTDGFKRSSPPVMVVVPVYVFASPKVCKPDPDLTMEIAPVMIPEFVLLPSP